MENRESDNPFLAALFAAEKIAKPGKIDGVRVGGSDVKVSTSDLAPKILAYAFLQLRDEGAISLLAVSKKVLFVKATFVQVQRLLTFTVIGGAAAQLFASVKNGKTIKDAVYAWYPGDMSNPWPRAIQIATQEAIQAGYLIAQQQNLGDKIGALFSGAIPTTIVPERQAQIGAIGDEAAARWAQYALNERELLDLLVKQCASGISARAAVDTSVGTV